MPPAAAPTIPTVVMTPKGEPYTIPVLTKPYRLPVVMEVAQDFLNRMERLWTTGAMASCPAEVVLATKLNSIAVYTPALKAFVDATGLRTHARQQSLSRAHGDLLEVRYAKFRNHLRTHWVMPHAGPDQPEDERLLGVWVRRVLRKLSDDNPIKIETLKILKEEGFVPHRRTYVYVPKGADSETAAGEEVEPAAQPTTPAKARTPIHPVLRVGDVFRVPKALAEDYRDQEALVIETADPEAEAHWVRAQVLNTNGTFDPQAPEVHFYQTGTGVRPLYTRGLLPHRRMVARQVWEVPPTPPRTPLDRITAIAQGLDILTGSAKLKHEMTSVLLLVPGHSLAQLTEDVAALRDHLKVHP